MNLNVSTGSTVSLLASPLILALHTLLNNIVALYLTMIGLVWFAWPAKGQQGSSVLNAFNRYASIWSRPIIAQMILLVRASRCRLATTQAEPLLMANAATRAVANAAVLAGSTQRGHPPVHKSAGQADAAGYFSHRQLPARKLRSAAPPPRGVRHEKRAAACADAGRLTDAMLVNVAPTSQCSLPFLT